MPKSIKVVKIDELSKKTPKTKYKNKYEAMLDSSEKIREILKKKFQSKKNNSFKEQFNISKQKPIEKPIQSIKPIEKQIEKPIQSIESMQSIKPIESTQSIKPIEKKNPKEFKKPHYRTQKRSKIKIKDMDQKTIDSIFKDISEKKNNINKESLLKLFRTILNTNDISLTNKFIKIINKRQTDLLLYFLHITKNNSKAPLPLLKNLLYNYLTSNIRIIVYNN